MKKILLSITSAILFSVFAVPAFATEGEAKDEAAPKAEKKAKKGKKAKKADGEKKGDEAKAE